MHTLTFIESEQSIAILSLHLNVVICRLGFINLTCAVFKCLPSRKHCHDRDDHWHPQVDKHIASAGEFSQPCKSNKQQKKAEYEKCVFCPDRWDGDQCGQKCSDEG